jgi:hypothetical protein
MEIEEIEPYMTQAEISECVGKYDLIGKMFILFFWIIYLTSLAASITIVVNHNQNCSITVTHILLIFKVILYNTYTYTYKRTDESSMTHN